MAFDEARAAGVSELQTRIVSAAVLAPVALAALIFGGPPFALLVAVVAAIGLWEWTEIGGATEPMPRVAMVALLVAGLLALQTLDARLAAILLIAPTVLALAAGLFNRAFRWMAFGLAYMAVPCAGFILLRQPEPFGTVAVFFILVVVWATDIAAYFGGRAAGGPRLWPRVSPKKTWSGAIAGFAAASLAGGLTASFAGVPGGFWLGVLLAQPLSIAAQAGDLFESGVKRHFGVKDSGTIIPGHGGVLDRVDGLLAAAALAWLIAALGLGGALLSLPRHALAVGGGL